MKPTRGYSSPWCHSTLATTRRGLAPALRLVAEAGEEDLRLVRRPADGPRQQVADPLLQDRVGRQADGVADTLSFQQLVQLGLGERRVAAEPERQAALTVAGDHRLQHRAPAFGAVSVAGPQDAALQVAELVEDEQRVVTGTAEVAVPGRALLLAMGRALGTVHVEDDAVWRSPHMHPVDPGAGQVRERREVRLACQPLGLEAAHLAGRGRRSVHTLAADDGAHRRIAGEPLGIVDVFVAGEPAVDRLAQQAEQTVPDVPAAPPLGECRSGHRGQAEGVVQLAIGEQAAVRGDPRTVELQLDPAVEGDPKRRLLGFTRRVPTIPHPSVVPNPLKALAENRGDNVTRHSSRPGNPGQDDLACEFSRRYPSGSSHNSSRASTQ